MATLVYNGGFRAEGDVEPLCNQVFENNTEKEIAFVPVDVNGNQTNWATDTGANKLIDSFAIYEVTKNELHREREFTVIKSRSGKSYSVEERPSGNPLTSFASSKTSMFSSFGDFVNSLAKGKLVLNDYTGISFPWANGVELPGNENSLTNPVTRELIVGAIINGKGDPYPDRNINSTDFSDGENSASFQYENNFGSWALELVHDGSGNLEIRMAERSIKDLDLGACQGMVEVFSGSSESIFFPPVDLSNFGPIPSILTFNRSTKRMRLAGTLTSSERVEFIARLYLYGQSKETIFEK